MIQIETKQLLETEGPIGCFEISQYAMLCDSRGRTLIMKIAGNDGLWWLPGGRLHTRENWESGLRREIFEETGIRDFALDPSPLCAQTLISRRDIDRYGVIFFARLSDRQQEIDVQLSSEHSQFAWIDQASDISSFPFHRPAVMQHCLRLFFARIAATK